MTTRKATRTRAGGTAWKILVVSTVLPLLTAVPARASTTVAQWNMDELSGTVMNDSSGTGNNGTISNVALGASGISGALGDYAYGFDGSTSNVTVPKSASLNPRESDITLTVHINTTVRPGTGSFDFDLLRKGGGYSMELYPNRGGVAQGKCKFRGKVNGVTSKLVLQDGPDLADGAWHTIVCAKTSTGISLTVDGTTFTKSGTVGSIFNGKPVAVGWQIGGSDFFNGLMDDVSIVIG